MQNKTEEMILRIEIFEPFTSQGFAGVMCFVFLALFIYTMIMNEKNQEDWKKIASRMNDNEIKRIETDIRHTSVLDDLKNLIGEKLK